MAFEEARQASMSGKITALKVQTRNPNRVNVYVDDQFAFGLAAIAAGWLQVGQTLSDEKIAGLQAADEHETAYERALRYLGSGLRTEAEIRRKLQAKGLPPEHIQPVVERLQRAGLVDDQAYARAWVESRETHRPKGKRAVRAELRRKGILPEAAQAAVETIDEEQSAERAALDRAARLAHLSWPEFRAKLGGFLLRRGFAYSTAHAAVAQAWQAVRGQPPAEEEAVE